MAAQLLLGRIDYMLMADEEVEAVRSALRTDFARLAQIRFEDMPEGQSRYLMCSRAVPSDWLERLNAALSNRGSARSVMQ